MAPVDRPTVQWSPNSAASAGPARADNSNAVASLSMTFSSRKVQMGAQQVLRTAYYRHVTRNLVKFQMKKFNYSWRVAHGSAAGVVNRG
jgi:hypothetical protein